MEIATTKTIITGAASGLGAACARALRAQGGGVTILDHDAVRGAQVAQGIGAHFAPTDVRDAASVAAAIKFAKDKMGAITTCINCAGIATGEKTVGRDGPHNLGAFQRTIDINLVGTFNVLRLAAAEMAQNVATPDGERGVIINTASVAAFDGQKGQAAYGASKAGIAGLTLPVARDLARSGIRVMAIAPGIFLTPMLSGLGDAVMDGLAADVAFPKRLGRPEEYAALALHIISNAYLNGTVIRLDGALRMP